MTELAASFELGHQVIESMRKVRKETYPECSFHNVDFQDLVDEQELTHEKPLLDSVDLVTRDLPYIVQSSCEDANPHYHVLALEGMEDAVALRKGLMSPGAHGHLFLFCATVWKLAQDAIKGKGGEGQ